MSEAGVDPASGGEIPGFGDVVLVRFPFTDQTTTKRRAAVVTLIDAAHQCMTT